MWKVFAIFCVLLPGGECEKKYEIPETIYNTKEECLIKAQWKADQMIKFIEESGSALSFNIGCEKQKVEDSPGLNNKDDKLNYNNRKRKPTSNRA